MESGSSTRRYGLSKARIAAFEQCPRRLWLMVHRPDLAAFEEGGEARFECGHIVGEIARALHPGGVMIGMVLPCEIQLPTVTLVRNCFSHI